MQVAADLETSSPFYTRDEAAAYARCHVSTIDRAIARDELKAGGTRGKVLIRLGDLDEWIASRQRRHR